MKFSVIVCADRVNGIGKNGKLPWSIKEDKLRFISLTMGGVVIMGRKTWESIPERFRPLKDRINVVISRNYKIEGVLNARSLSEALSLGVGNNREIFVIGGSGIYQEALGMRECEKVYLTRVYGTFSCDVHLHGLDCRYKLIKCGEDLYNDDGLMYCFMDYIRSDGMEQTEREYLGLIKKVLGRGDCRQTRNAKTLSIFGECLEFDMSGGLFPLFTCRRVFLRGIFEELMWIIRGQTNTKILAQKRIHIWDKNSTREFLDNLRLQHLCEGDIGESYGFCMRHFGAEYKGCDADYRGKGIDQLSGVIHKIKHYPTDRRMIISLWNPMSIDRCALPPCVRDYQFYCRENYLDLQINIRSSDVPVALHWNICSGALFLVLMCHICSKVPGRIRYIVGDAHIYIQHREQAQELANRETRPLPWLKIVGNVKNIEDFEFKNLEVCGYHPDTRAVNVEMVA